METTHFEDSKRLPGVSHTTNMSSPVRVGSSDSQYYIIVVYDKTARV